LPALAQILAGQSQAILGRQEGTVESDGVADRAPHADRIPPSLVELDRPVGEVAGQKDKSVGCRGQGVACATGTVEVNEEDRPLPADCACGERLCAVEDVATVDFANAGPKAGFLVGSTGARLATPSDPLLAALHNSLKPAGLLPLVAEGGQ